MRLYGFFISVILIAIASVLVLRLIGEDSAGDSAPSITDGFGTSTDLSGADSADLGSPAAPDDLAPIAPSFDIVRIDPTGQAVLAGRAAGDAQVTLLADGRAIASTQADWRGDWTMIIETPLETGEVTLTLRSISPGGTVVPSDQSVVVAVPDRPGAVPLVVLDGPEFGSRVLQAPEDGVGAPDLAVDSVDYDEDGRVLLSGRAERQALLRLYLDNVPVGTVRADDDGLWRLTLEDRIAPGRYTLRADRLDPDGTVLARIELPFERAAPEALEQAALTQGRIVVQPGNSLWRIARRVYGRGVQYTVIYQANQDQIRDPDLIYPGQIFEVPGP